ncbi:MAG TPA: hypothetical protein VFY13_01660, partial [Luteolibacter sp.]|nr:hypothetical protein [Luteolibacter sp.]
KLVEELQNGGRISIEGESPKDAAALLARLVRDGLAPIEFRREQQNLEDAFITMMRELDVTGVPATPPALSAQS